MCGTSSVVEQEDICGRVVALRNAVAGSLVPVKCWVGDKEGWLRHAMVAAGVPAAKRSRSRTVCHRTLIPKLARASTGKGMPYLVPGYAFSTRGTRVITLPTKTVPTPWGVLHAGVVKGAQLCIHPAGAAQRRPRLLRLPRSLRHVRRLLALACALACARDVNLHATRRSECCKVKPRRQHVMLCCPFLSTPAHYGSFP